MRLRGQPRVRDGVAFFRRDVDPVVVIGTFELMPDVNEVVTKSCAWTRKAAEKLKPLVIDARVRRDQWPR